MTNITVTLPDDLLDFLDRIVEKENFVDRGEALRDLLRKTKKGVQNTKASSEDGPRGGMGGDMIIQMRVPDELIP